ALRRFPAPVLDLRVDREPHAELLSGPHSSECEPTLTAFRSGVKELPFSRRGVVRGLRARAARGSPGAARGRRSSRSRRRGAGADVDLAGGVAGWASGQLLELDPEDRLPFRRA